MAKNRRTRKEKIRSANRSHSLRSDMPAPSSEQPSSVFTFVSSSTSPVAKPDAFAAIYPAHLREDLFRTTTVIAAIIFAEIALFYLLTNR